MTISDIVDNIRIDLLSWVWATDLRDEHRRYISIKHAHYAEKYHTQGRFHFICEVRVSDQTSWSEQVEEK